MELKGRFVIVIFVDGLNRLFKYSGKCLGINDSTITLEEVKEGILVLPIASCKIEVPRGEGDG